MFLLAPYIVHENNYAVGVSETQKSKIFLGEHAHPRSLFLQNKI